MSGAPGRLSRAAAEGLYRVMAYKDEYEVARLHAAATYGDKPVFHMSPPLIDRHRPGDRPAAQDRDPGLAGAAAVPRAAAWQACCAARARSVRLPGERRQERALIEQYIADLRSTVAALRPDTLDVAVAIARAAGSDPRLRAGEGCQPDEGAGAAQRAAAALADRPVPVAAE